MISMELVNKIYAKEEWRKLTQFMTHSFHLYNSNLEILKVVSLTKKIALSQEYGGKQKSFKSKFELANAHKYKTRKRLRELEDKLHIIAEKVNNVLSVEDLFLLRQLCQISNGY